MENFYHHPSQTAIIAFSFIWLGFVDSWRWQKDFTNCGDNFRDRVTQQVQLQWQTASSNPGTVETVLMFFYSTYLKCNSY
jgi:hypothetical protein